MSKKIRRPNVPSSEALTFDGLAVANMSFNFTMTRNDNQPEKVKVRAEFVEYAVGSNGIRHFGKTREAVVIPNYNNAALIDALIEEAAVLYTAEKGDDTEVT